LARPFPAGTSPSQDRTLEFALAAIWRALHPTRLPVRIAQVRHELQQLRVVPVGGVMPRAEVLDRRERLVESWAGRAGLDEFRAESDRRVEAVIYRGPARREYPELVRAGDEPHAMMQRVILLPVQLL
jgi:hypothetical protein